VLYTRNQGDFSRLHNLIVASGRSHAGIIILRGGRRPSIGAQLAALTNAMNDYDQEEWRNRLEFLRRWM